jgi:tetratricopeptide (TPR) repeat protein
MRRLNLKLLLILLILAATLGGGAYALNRWQVTRSASRLGVQASETLAQAEKAASADKAPLYQKAADLYTRYLRYYPNDLDALASYARLLADTAVTSDQGEAALGILNRVQGSSKYANDPEILRRIVRLSVGVGRYGEAEKLIQELLTEGRPDYDLWVGDAEVRRALAFCRESRSENELAIADYRKAADLDPLDPMASARLARLLGLENQAEESNRVIDRLVRSLEEARTPDDAEERATLNQKRAQAHLLRAQQHMEATPRTPQGKIPEDVATAAAADTARAIELVPDQFEPLREAAQIASNRERPDWNEIRRLLEPALEKFAEDPRLYLALAEAYVSTQRLEDAISVLERGRRITDNTDIMFALANLYIDQGVVDAPADATTSDHRSPPRRLLEEMRRRSYEKGKVALLEARLIMADRDQNSRPVGDTRWSLAARIFRDEVLSVLAPSDTMTGEARRLIVMCIDNDPTLPDEEKEAQKAQVRGQIAVADDTSTLRRMAATSEALGRYTEAAQTYASIPNPTPELILMRGRAELMAALERPPTDRDWSQLEGTLALLDRVAHDNPGVATLRAEMLVARNDVDRAQTTLDAARRAYPERIELWAASVALAERRNQPQVVEQLIAAAEAQTTSPDRPLTDKIGAMLLRVRQMGARGGPESIARLDALGAKVAEIVAPEDRRRLLRGLVDAYIACNEPKRALDRWLKFLDQSNSVDTLAGQTVAFDLALIAGDREAQGRAIERMKSPRIEGETGIYWRLAQARRNIAEVQSLPETERQGEAARGLLAEARRHLEEVGRQRANNFRIASALGTVADLEGRSEEAANQYYTAFRLGERDLDILRRTISLLTAGRRYTQARTILESILQRSAMTPDLERMASQIAFYDRDYTRAIVQAQTAVDKGSTDPLDYTWLAQLLLATGRRPEAEAMFRKAVEIAPERPEGHLMLIEYLIGFGRPEVAAAVAAAEKALAASNPQGLAQCLELVGREAEADAIYRRLLGEQLQGALTPALLQKADNALLRNYATFLARRGRRNDARAVFEAIVARSAADAERSDDRQWARSLLSMVLARDSDPETTREALTGIGLPTDPNADLSAMASTENNTTLRTKARVLAMQRDPGYRRQAIQILVKLQERRLADAGDLLLLARLHELSKDWNRAQISYRDAIDANPSDLRALVFYIQALLRRKEPASVIAPWIARLEKARGESPLSTQLRALVLKNEKKDDQAIALLTEFGSKHPDQTPNTARVLELMGYEPAAEALLRPYVEKTRATNPAVVLVLAEFLGRRDRVKEALDLCEPLWSSPDPTTVAEVSVNVLLGHDDPESGRRVERWLQRAIALNPENTHLQAMRGVLLLTLGRPAEAEALYRSLLEKDSSDPLVLNNLAWLLAFQEGKSDEALELINRAIDRVGTNIPSLLDTRAVVRLARREPVPAIRDLEMAISEIPEPGMYFHLARAQLMAGQDEAARRSWDDGQLMGLKRNTVDPAERSVYDEIQGRMSKAPTTAPTG